MTARSNPVPGVMSAVSTVASVTLTRLGRGKALWIGLLLAALPVINAKIVHTYAEKLRASPSEMFAASLGLLVLLPAMFIGASIGEEIEERTATYLWSRPVARWAVIAGKLCALAPIVIALIVGGWFAAHEIWVGGAPTLTSCVALAAGCLAASLIAAGVASVLPKHGMGFTIAYMFVDIFVGALPFSLRELSVTHQAAVLSQLGDSREITTPAIMLIMASGVWSVIGLLRIQRLEA